MQKRRTTTASYVALDTTRTVPLRLRTPPGAARGKARGWYALQTPSAPPHLPEGQEQHRLDAQELGHGIERRERRLEHEVEHAQAIEGVADAQVHHEGNVQPPPVDAEVSLRQRQRADRESEKTVTRGESRCKKSNIPKVQQLLLPAGF